MGKKVFSNLFLYMVIVFLVIPVVVLFVWSFTRTWEWPNLLPSRLGLRGWLYFFDPSTKSLKVLWDSISLSSVVTVITLCISIPAAKALTAYRFRGKEAIEILILSPIIVPQLAVAMGIHLQFIKMGLADTYVGVVLVHLIPCLPYGVRILSTVYEAIGENMELQGKVLGASKWQVLRFITFPLIAPGLISAGSLVFIISFSQYFLTFLIGGGKVITLPMVLFPFIQSGDRMLASVFSIVFIMTTLIFCLVMERTLKIHYKESNYFYL